MSLAERLEVLITANVDGAIKGFKTVGDTAEAELKKAEGGSTNAAASMTKFGAGAVAAAGVAGVALFELSKKWEESALSAGKMATATGLTSEEASRWSVVAQNADVDTATLTGSMGKMLKAVEANPDEFDKLGAAIVRTNSGAIDTQATFLNVVDALQRAGGAANVANDATKILGKGWQSMSELLDQSTADLKTQLASVNPSQVFSAGDVKQAEDYRASMKELGNTLDSLAMSIGKGVVPVVGDLAKGISTVVGWFGSLNAVTDGAAGKVLAIGTVVVGAAGALSLLGGALTKVKGLFIESATANEALTVSEGGAAAGAEVETLALTGVGKAALFAGGALAIVIGLQEKQQLMQQQDEKYLAAAAVLWKGMSDTTLSNADALKAYVEASKDSMLAGRSMDELNKDFATTNIDGAKRLLELGKAGGVSAEYMKSLAAAIAAASVGLDVHKGKLADDAIETSSATTETVALTKAQEAAAVAAELNARGMDDGTISARYQERAQGALAEQTKILTKNVDDQEAAFQNVKKAIDDERAAALASIDTDAAYNEQVLQTDLDLKAYEKTLKEHKGTTEETMLATAKMGDEVYATAQKFAEQQGAVKGSQQAIDLEVESLTQTRNTLDPSSALYQYLDGYIKKLQSIPTSVSTSISAQGKIGGHAYASGTRSAASGLALVGEDGPEIVNFGGGEGVTPAGPTAALLNGGGGHTFIINTGADPRQVITIIKQYLKNGGQL